MIDSFVTSGALAAPVEHAFWRSDGEAQHK
jgi:hypothetical protein